MQDRSRLRRTTLLPLLAVLAGTAKAQLGEPKGVRINAQQIISAALKKDYPNNFGVIHASNGDYFVGTGKADRADNHLLVKITAGGNYLKSYDQPREILSTPNGFYDLAYDDEANIIYGGTDYSVSRKLYAFDVKAEKFDTTKAITIPADVEGKAARALTYDPDGNSGKGSFWIGDGSSKISEISKDGKLLRTTGNVHPNTQAAAFDDEARLVWWFGPGATSKANQGVVGIAMHVTPTTAEVTEMKVLGDNSIPGGTIPGGTIPGGTVRGAQIWEEEATDHESLFMLVLTDVKSDWFYEMAGAFVVEEGCGGGITFGGDACYAGNSAWHVNLTDSAATVAALVVATDELIDGMLLPSPPFKRNCRLHPRLDANFIVFPPLPVKNRSARQPTPIPNDKAFVGLSLFFQWFEVGTGPLPLSMSEEGEIFVHN